MKHYYFFTALFLSLFLLSSCKEKILPPQSRIYMDTVCSINLYDQGTERLYNEVFERISQIEKACSVTLEDSDLSRVNLAAGLRPEPVSYDVYNLFEISRRVSEISEGAFDISMNPVISLWGINTENARVPEQNEIAAALENVGWERIHFAGEDVPWCHLERGMSLNLGAVAKGYCADVVCEILDEKNVQKAIVDLGGNIYCYGKKEDGNLWTVGIKNPEEPSGEPLLKLRTEETSVVTSGIYERFLERNGKQYHHIFDPETGYPAHNELASVTVICKASTAADALSTTFFVLGQEKSLIKIPLFEKLFGMDIDVVFIHKDGSVFATKNLEGKLSLYSAADNRKITYLSKVLETSAYDEGNVK